MGRLLRLPGVRAVRDYLRARRFGTGSALSRRRSGAEVHAELWMNEFGSIEARVGEYYTSKLDRHGANHLGVDWNSPESQALRFSQLLYVVDRRSFPLNTYCCGYGALLDQLVDDGFECEYHGFDISEAMVAVAREQHEAHFTTDFDE